MESARETTIKKDIILLLLSDHKVPKKYLHRLVLEHLLIVHEMTASLRPLKNDVCSLQDDIELLLKAD